MTGVIVFLGPTLPREVARKLLDAEFRAPAAQGDVYRATLSQPRAIVIVDGYHRSVPAVWHKEILWALAQGIRVYGTASMGALRAAELHAFGMEGVGWVYEQFAANLLEDDDEVAIAHASAELGYRALSEAMVNIRATLRAAHEAGILPIGTMHKLCAIAKLLPYQERSWPVLWQAAGDHVDLGEFVPKLRRWVTDNRVDQKAQDALCTLRLVREAQSGDARRAPKIDFEFARTDAWEAFVQRHRPVAAAATQVPLLYGMLLEELKLRGIWARVHHAAWARSQADSPAASRSPISPTLLQHTADQFRRERSLFEPEQFEAWIATQRVVDHELAPFFAREARARRSQMVHEAQLSAYVVDYLRASGEFAELSNAALARSRRQPASSLTMSELAGQGTSESELWRWYFERFFGTAPPAALAVYARNMCLCTPEELEALVIQEFVALRVQPG